MVLSLLMLYESYDMLRHLVVGVDNGGGFVVAFFFNRSCLLE
jgi:hypothetical protein